MEKHGCDARAPCVCAKRGYVKYVSGVSMCMLAVDLEMTCPRRTPVALPVNAECLP